MRENLEARLILLNGACSAGKSSLAHELQNLLVEPNIFLGIDAYHLAIPKEKLNLREPDQNYLWPEQWVDKGETMTLVRRGPLIKRIDEARFLSTRHFLNQGISVIADEVFWELDDIKRFLRLMQGLNVLLVKVNVKEKLGEERIALRSKILKGDVENFSTNFRPEGMCRASSRLVHKYMEYDLFIDTSKDDPLTCAQHLYECIGKLAKPSAFIKLINRYGPFLQN